MKKQKRSTEGCSKFKGPETRQYEFVNRSQLFYTKPQIISTDFQEQL